jgi:predicted transposase/invertase (TIGR01784 family)
MQKAKQNFFKDRSVLCLVPDIGTGQEGDWNYQLSAIYLVGILDFVFPEDGASATVRHEVQLKDQENQVFYDKLTFIYLEMPNFKKTELELDSDFDKWMFVLQQLPRLDSLPHRLADKVFTKLFKAEEIARFTQEEQQKYNESLKYYRDLKNVVDTSYEESRTEGREEGKMEIARQMKSMSEPIDKIMLYTGLTEANIARL